MAERAGVSAGTIVAFETLGSDPKVSTLQKLRRVFAQEGIDLIEDGAPSLDGGPGLRLRKGAVVPAPVEPAAKAKGRGRKA